MRYALFLKFALLTFLTVLLGVGNPQSAQSQDRTTDSKKARKLYEAARKQEASRQVRDALSSLLQAVEEDPTFSDAHLMLARFYQMYFPDAERSAYHYKQCAKHHPDNPRFLDAYYAVAKAAIGRGDYDEAYDYASKYLSITHTRKKFFQQAKRILANAEFAREAIKNPVPFDPKPLPNLVNRLDQQYYPSFTADRSTMYFSGFVNGRDENLFRTEFKDGQWTEPTYIRELNTHENEGSSFVSADGKTMIFSAVEGRIRRNMGKCDLYITHNVGGRWSEPENMGAPVNGETWESQPSLSADGRKLFFISMRPSGEGRHDIWMTQLDSTNRWTEPVSLGPTINTPADEFTPFIHPNGRTLYFASNGHPGFGGIDLYKSELIDGEWQTPVNLGYPINDHNDQRSIFISADGQLGIYTQIVYTNSGQRRSILSAFQLADEITVSQKSSYVKGTVYDAETGKKLQASIELRDLSSDQLISQTQSDPVNGDYLMVLTEGARYGLFASKPGYLFKSLTFDLRDSTDTLAEVLIDIYLNPAKAGAKVTLSNLFFASGSYELEGDSKSELAKVHRFLTDNPSLRVKISGHTDDVGSDAANQQLSEQRAQAVKDYLGSMGINAERLEAKGYGETKPEVPNTSDANRAQNRRIEFEIMKS